MADPRAPLVSINATVAAMAIALCGEVAPAGIPEQTERQQLMASDGAEQDSFGAALQQEGDTLIIGAPQHISNGLSGSFYVFTRSGDGSWTEQERIWSPLDPVGEYGDSFGSALALDGDMLLVGASTTSASDGGTSGAAYMYRRQSGSEWMLHQTLPSVSPNFGQSVALIGDLAVVAGYDAAVVFTCDAEGLWSTSAPLAEHMVSVHVACDGQTIVVGGRFAQDQIGVSLYALQDGAWVPDGTISMVTTPFPANAYMRVSGLSIDGDRFAMGINNAFGPDYVDLYERQESGAWTRQAMLDPDDIEGDQFGGRLVLRGNQLLVGALSGGLGGRVHLYERAVAGEWAESLRLTPSDAFFGQYFGRAIDFTDGVPVIGSGHHDNGLHSGAVYVFEQIGMPVSADVNGDGAVDVDDLVALLLAWGACPPPPDACPADIDGNGAVDVDDLVEVILQWGS